MKNLKTLLAAILIALLCAGTTSCGLPSFSKDTTGTSADNLSVSPVTVEYDEYDDMTEYSSTDGDTVEITLGSGDVNITSGGTYLLSGTLTDGCISVNSADSENVRLILDGVTITNSDAPAIIITQADKVIITTAEGSVNTISDGSAYSDTAVEAGYDAAIYSKDDLTLNGEGSLTVNGNYNHGVHCKDDLKVTGGTLTVNSVNDGLKGKDSVAVKNAVITVNAAGGDGIQSNNAEDTEKGYVSIESGSINITAGSDGIQAETNLSVTGGEINVTTGGGAKTSANNNGGYGGGWVFRDNSETSSTSTETSVKGLKAGVLLTVSGGSITVSASDDGAHSNGNIVIGGDCAMTLAAGGDGIHADGTVQIDGGTVNITQSYEGIEGGTITVNGGTISLVASDDGFNATDGSSTMGGFGFGGMGGESVTDTHIYINGGIINVNANGDGIDSNGNVYMNGGELYVDGPADSGNGALDYAGSFEINGGIFIAAGSSGMALNANAGTQCSMLVNFTTQQAGTKITITDASGYIIAEYTPSKQYSSIVVSTPELVTGMTYTLTAGGSELTTIEMSSQFASSGGSGGMFGGMGGGNMGGNFGGGGRRG